MEEIITVEVQAKAKETKTLAETYDNYIIRTPEAYENAAGDLKIVKAKSKELDGLRKSLTIPLDQSKKRIMDFFRVPIGLLVAAETAIKRAMIKWQQAQEAIRRAEENRLADLQAREAKRLAYLAEKAEQRGDTKKAEQFAERTAAVQATTPTVAGKVAPISGISKMVVWKFSIVDADKIPRPYMMPNETAIGQVVRATKGSVKIEGIEIYSEETIRA